jgi:hypothetical protein
MDSELEKQLERLEGTVAEILAAVRKRRAGQPAAAGDASEINDRLRRFLEKKK